MRMQVMHANCSNVHLVKLWITRYFQKVTRLITNQFWWYFCTVLCIILKVSL